MNIDPSVTKNINALWATPYGVAGKWAFILGVLILFTLLIFRHKMSVVDAALAIVGLKPVVKRDIWFNLSYIGVLVISFGLLMLSMIMVQ